MNSRVVRAFILAFAIAILVTSSSPFAGPSTQRTEPVAAVRGLWVLRTSMTSPQSIAHVVKTAVDGGYNTLLVQVRSRGDAFYKSEIDPRAPELARQPATFDPLAAMLTAARAAGLKVHAWVNVNLVSSAVTLPDSRSHVARRHPDWLMVPKALAPELLRVNPSSPAYLDRLARWSRSERDSVEGLFLSPVSDEAQNYTVSVIRSLVESYALDGVHLDYIRYPSLEFDYSAATLRAFRAARLGTVEPGQRDKLDRDATSDPLVWTRAFPESWSTFRSSRLTILVQRIRGAVKAARPDAVLSSAVVPDPVEARDERLQNWEGWANTRLLDVVCPMAYAAIQADFSNQVSKAVAAAGDRPVWVGVGAWRLPVERTAAHLTTVRRAGAAGVLLFSYDSLVRAGSPSGTYFTRLRSALLNPPRDE